MPRKRNHTVMTGPNALPMVEVPAFCMAKRMQRITRVMPTTMAWLSPMMP